MKVLRAYRNNGAIVADLGGCSFCVMDGGNYGLFEYPRDIDAEELAEVRALPVASEAERLEAQKFVDSVL